MTYEELIGKRARKKRRKKYLAGAAAAALVLLASGGVLSLRSGGLPFLSGRSAPYEQTDEMSREEEELRFDVYEVAEPEPEPEIDTGWHSDENGRYYIGSDGERLTGWFTDPDGSIYLFGSDGYALTGWQEPDIGNVWFDDSGAMITGLREIDGKKYYFGYDGVSLSGWQDDGDDTYYFSYETGEAVTGWQKINGEDCWFDENGIYDPTAVKEVPDGPMVALTFDDGPGEYTERLLGILDKYGVKATFFMIGEQVEYYRSAVLHEYEMGMEQGNHSWDHKTLTHLSAEDIRKELSSTNSAIRAVTGEDPTVFRPPGGGYNSEVLANSLGMPAILWSIDTLDWSTLDADRTYNTVMNEVRDGSIILMHEIYKASVDAAERLIPALLDRGYKLVTVSELASARGITLAGGEIYGQFHTE